MPVTQYASRMLLQGINEPVETKATSLTEKLEQVRHLHLNLSADHLGSCRPNISLWPATNDDLPPASITMKIDGAWGQQTRYADFTPEEARTLAKYLIDSADLIDREVLAHVTREVEAVA